MGIKGWKKICILGRPVTKASCCTAAVLVSITEASDHKLGNRELQRPGIWNVNMHMRSKGLGTLAHTSDACCRLPLNVHPFWEFFL